MPGAVPYVTVPYVDRMDLAYAAADFALCRAGAMTCAELTAVGLPAVYVPLPIGNGEQRLNALPIVQRGGGLLVEDAELTADWIKTSLLPVLTNIDQVAGMSEAAAALGRRDADRWLAKAVIDVAAETAAPRRPGAQAVAGRRGGSRPPGAGRHRQNRSAHRAGTARGRGDADGPGHAHRAGAARRARAGPLRRHRRRGHVRDRPHHAGPRAPRCPAATPPPPPPSTSSPRWAPGCTSGHAPAQLGDADTLVVSSAIRESNPELAEARRRGLRVLHRARRSPR